MIKYVLTAAFFAALVFLPGHARSQTQVTPPPCFPLINGQYNIAPRLYVGEVGEHVYWFCASRKDGPIRVYGFSWFIGKRMETAYLSAVAAISSATAKVSEAQKQYVAAITYNCDDPAVVAAQTEGGLLCRERERILAAALPGLLRK